MRRLSRGWWDGEGRSGTIVGTRREDARVTAKDERRGAKIRIKTKTEARERDREDQGRRAPPACLLLLPPNQPEISSRTRMKMSSR